METIRLIFIVWGCFGFLATTIGLIALRKKSVDSGIKISGGINLFYTFLTALSAWLSLEPLPQWWTYTVAPMGFAAIILSQVLSIWAKRALGNHFSPNITPAEESNLITTGPFAICRHPMMFSYLMLWFGTAMALGSIIMIVSFGLASVAIMRRVALEEMAMIQNFGESFGRYCNKTSLIVPFLNTCSQDAKDIDDAVRELAGPNWIQNIWKWR